MSSYEQSLVVGIDSMAGLSHVKPSQSHLLLLFPDHKRTLRTLSYDQKMEWYAYQFEKNRSTIPVELTTKEFASFWKWQVLIPMKIKRFYYRVKNGEVFKRYSHITEMKKKVKNYSI